MNRTCKAIFIKFLLILTLVFLSFTGHPVWAAVYPLAFTDSTGRDIVLTAKPKNVVSISPTITDIIFRLGADDLLSGMTYHTKHPPRSTQKGIIGGFFGPSVRKIKGIGPDVVFAASLHEKQKDEFCREACTFIVLDADSITDIYKNIELLGRIFDKEQRAADIIADMKEEFDLVARKVARIPENERKRVIRLMGRNRVMTPGDDSFQNDFIRAAGGIPPSLGKTGSVVPVTEEEWVAFNPDWIYGCGGDRETAAAFFQRPGWKDVGAVRQGHVRYFPCDLTCRASVNSAYFVSWLSSIIYCEEFSRPENLVLKEEVVARKPVDINLGYVESAQIIKSVIYDFHHKTLALDFKEPMTIVSTLEGQRSGIISIGNHYTPPQYWSISHQRGLQELRQHIYGVIGKKEEQSSFLFTGANMDNLSVQKTSFKDMVVYALVTAGVAGNAVRMSVSEGAYYEPGTINIILLTNMKLTPRAMTRAIISATEAKTAAIQDMDVRCSQQPIYQATGTGTDNIIVIQGTGTTINNAGGHTKMGELLAKAVYTGVKEAVYKQNGLITKRNIFRRLEERNIHLLSLVSQAQIPEDVDKRALFLQAQDLLLDPEYAAFIETAMAVSDAYDRGLIADLEMFRQTCHAAAEKIADRKLDRLLDLIGSGQKLTPVMQLAIDALLNGLYHRET